MLLFCIFKWNPSHTLAYKFNPSLKKQRVKKILKVVEQNLRARFFKKKVDLIFKLFINQYELYIDHR